MADDHLLIQQILAGHQSAFRRFVERYQKLVSHIVFRMVPNRSDREDMCQEVFMKAYRNLAGFQFGSRLSTWVGRIAYNTCVNYLQKKKVPLLDDLAGSDSDRDSLEAIPGGEASPDLWTEQRDLLARVRREMDSLSPQYRALLTLYHLDEMSYEEIAEVTDLPMGTVKSYLFRARKALRDRLKEKYRMEDIWQQGT